MTNFLSMLLQHSAVRALLEDPETLLCIRALAPEGQSSTPKSPITYFHLYTADYPIQQQLKWSLFFRFNRSRQTGKQPCHVSACPYACAMLCTWSEQVLNHNAQEVWILLTSVMRFAKKVLWRAINLPFWAAQHRGVHPQGIILFNSLRHLQLHFFKTSTASF